MNFERIVSQSFKIAFKKPSLWIFGMLAGGGVTNFHIRETVLPKGDIALDPHQLLDLLMPLLGVWILLIVISIVTTVISTTGLIEAVNHLVRGGRYRFGTCLSRGIDLFWRMLGLVLIEGLLIVVAIMAMALAVMVSWATLLLTVPAFIVFLFVWIGTMLLAKRTAVIRDIGAIEAIEEGFLLLRQNLQQCLGMAAIAIGIGIIFGLFTLVIVFVVFAPINSFVETILSDDLSILLAALLMGLPISFVFGGISGTVGTNLGTMFYLALVEPDKEHRLDETPIPPDGWVPPDSDKDKYGPV